MKIDRIMTFTLIEVYKVYKLLKINVRARQKALGFNKSDITNTSSSSSCTCTYTMPASPLVVAYIRLDRGAEKNLLVREE